MSKGKIGMLVSESVTYLPSFSVVALDQANRCKIESPAIESKFRNDIHQAPS